jgi:large subunit ribosomal protein L13
MTEHTIDATHKSIGRLASEISRILQGKHLASYNPRLEGEDIVRVTNVARLTISSKKLIQKKFYHHSGPLGHLKEQKLGDVMKKKPGWALRHAVINMLPKNRLRAKRLKRLFIS